MSCIVKLFYGVVLTDVVWWKSIGKCEKHWSTSLDYLLFYGADLSIIQVSLACLSIFLLLSSVNFTREEVNNLTWKWAKIFLFRTGSGENEDDVGALMVIMPKQKMMTTMTPESEWWNGNTGAAVCKFEVSETFWK